LLLQLACIVNIESNISSTHGTGWSTPVDPTKCFDPTPLLHNTANCLHVVAHEISYKSLFRGEKGK
jgi:hypothetical protein